MKKKLFKYGGMSVTVTVLFLAGVVLLNMLVGLLSDRLYWKVDLTPGGLFEIGEDTSKILRDMDEPVTFTVLSTEADYQNTGGLMVVREILQKYAAMSDGKITLQYVDPNLNPALAQQYSLVTLTSRDILVESGRRYTSISYMDLFQTGTDNQTGSQYIAAVQAEQKLTNALLYVLNERVAKAVILTGHDEYRSPTFETFLKDSYYLVEEADLSVSDMPEGATLAIISAPAGDYTGDEINKLDAFLASGGNVLWLDSEEGRDRPNLKRYFEEWGISFEASIAFEPEQSNPLYRFIIYPQIAEHESTALIDQSSNMKFMAPINNPVTRLFESKNNRTTRALLTTSAQSYARPYDSMSTSTTFDREPGDVSGPFDVAILSTETTYDSQAGTQRHSVLAMSVNCVDYFDSSNLNARFFSSVLNYMNPSAETVYVTARSVVQGSMQILSGQSFVLFWVLIIIPLLILVLGIVVWRRRRHL